jgi:Tol biopolymer transport system component
MISRRASRRLRRHPHLLATVLSVLATVPAARLQEPPQHRRVAGLRDLTGSVSSDGRYYAFTNWQSSQLGIKDLSSGEERYIVTPESEQEYPYAPRFAPDGRRIAYLWRTAAGSGELRVVNVDGSGVRTLVRDWPEPHDWSPDGSHILTIVSGSVAVVSVADGTVTELAALGWRSPIVMRLSPDGRYVAYDGLVAEDSPRRDIFLLAVETGKEIALVEDPAIARVLDWTPDGTRILFDSDRGMEPGSGRRAWLVEVADGVGAGSPTLVRPELEVGRGLGFDRDGSYFYCCGPAPAQPRGGLYLADFDPTTGELRTPRLIEGGIVRAIDWSPDGRSMAYAYHSLPFPSTLGIRAVESGEERRVPLTIHPRQPFALQWSPDGMWLLAQGYDHRDRWGVYRIDAKTGRAVAVVQEPAVHWPAWLHDGRIAYVLPDESGGSQRILVHDLGMSEVHEISRVPVPAYLSQLAASPDGRWLAFLWSNVWSGWQERGDWALKVVPVTGGAPRDLARLSVQGRDSLSWHFRPSVAWTSDAQYVLYTITTVGEDGAKTVLWRIPAVGGEAHPIDIPLPGFGVTGMSMHPGGRQIAFTGMYQREVREIAQTEDMWVLENFLPPPNDGR